jgi:hypothetical protein
LKKELKTLTSKLTIDINKLNKREIDVGSTDLLREEIAKKIATLNKLQGESTVASRATSRAPARASREASRASARAPRASREASRASARAASNRVVQDPFPYQIADSNKRSDISNIMSDKKLTALEKTTLWAQLNQLNKAKI